MLPLVETTESPLLPDKPKPRQKHWPYVLLGGAAIAVPILSVTFPPSTDLPQHVAQGRLFWEALQNPASDYRIHWLIPYSAVYVVIGALWKMLPALEIGRATLLIIGLLWVLTLQGLCRARNRAPEVGLIATIFFFNHCLYWGFLSFIFGFPFFAAIVHLMTAERVSDARRHPWRDAVLFGGVCFLAYLSHVLWFGVAMIWCAAAALLFRIPPRDLRARLATTLPTIGMAAWFYFGLRSQTAAVNPAAYGAFWTHTPILRIATPWTVDALLGGLQGWIEPMVLTFCTIWAALGVLQARRKGPGQTDSPLLFAGCLLIVLGLILPSKYQNTIFFSNRWMPFGGAMVFLAFPVPHIGRLWRNTIAVALMALFIGYTTVKWRAYEKTELSGLREAIEVLPEKPRLLGLDFARESRIVKSDAAFLQMPAYGQVYRGGGLNFSFADFPQTFVQYKSHESHPWSSGLEWRPYRLRPSDLQYFDFVLVNGDESAHAFFSGNAALTRVTQTGRWHLYRVQKTEIR